MARILKLSDQECNSYHAYAKHVMDKVDSMQEQMGNVSREMEMQRKNQKEMLERKKNKTV